MNLSHKDNHYTRLQFHCLFHQLRQAAADIERQKERDESEVLQRNISKGRRNILNLICTINHRPEHQRKGR